MNKEKGIKKQYPSSEKVYIKGKLFDIQVPMRKITLTDTVEIVGDKTVFHPNAPIYVYDTSGFYTDENITVDIKKGLSPVRETWILERKDVVKLYNLSSEYGQKRLKDKSLDHLRFEHIRLPHKAKQGHGITQMYYAKNNIITAEMEYVAIRENQNAESLGIHS
ncbi:MAG: phosphomethylpyrimidine synthase, partial [Bacteroidales bacterium]|nr:phosphomethylpyrimidine synthase [Bacteroidales bacterium]